jgi:hypothetical protein
MISMIVGVCAREADLLVGASVNLERWLAVFDHVAHHTNETHSCRDIRRRAEAAATPIKRLAVDTNASSEPSTVARGHPERPFGAPQIAV